MLESGASLTSFSLAEQAGMGACSPFQDAVCSGWVGLGWPWCGVCGGQESQPGLANVLASMAKRSCFPFPPTPTPPLCHSLPLKATWGIQPFQVLLSPVSTRLFLPPHRCCCLQHLFTNVQQMNACSCPKAFIEAFAVCTGQVGSAGVRVVAGSVWWSPVFACSHIASPQ